MGITMVDTAPAPFPESFPETVREGAFYIWMAEANRSPAATARILAEQATAERDDAAAPPTLPSEKTIATWARRHDWRGKALAALADGNQARIVLSDAFAKTLVAANVTIERVAALADLPLDDPKHHRTVIEAHKAILESLKTLAAFGATLPQLVAPSERRDPTPRTREQIVADQLERIRRAKLPKKGKA